MYLNTLLINQLFTNFHTCKTAQIILTKLIIFMTGGKPFNEYYITNCKCENLCKVAQLYKNSCIYSF